MADHKLQQIDSDDSAKHQTLGGDSAIAVVDRDAIRGVLVRFLKEVDTPFPNPQYDHQFAQAACQEALRLGFPPTHFFSPEFQQTFQPGAAMCMTLYPHLNISSRYYICIYTACVAYLDDLALRDANVVREFNASFLEKKRHAHPLLDSFATLLRTTQDHFSENNASMIITSTLDFISSLVMEHDQQGMTVHTAATNYPVYLRYMTGIARAYALFFFPQSVPLRTYIQIIPDMIHYINDVNDIFSFYKEELVGETCNQICLVAGIRGCTKLEAMAHLAQVSIDCAARIATVLESHPEARALAQKYLVQGYIDFHTLSHERYKLDDLLLYDEK